MLLACWSSKGGAGTTVVAATLALLLGRSRAGRRAPRRPGRRRPRRPRPRRSRQPRASPAGWRPGPTCRPTRSTASRSAPPTGSRLLPRGDGTAAPRSAPTCSLASSPPTGAPVVVDCGTDPSGVALAVAASATRSLLVTRPCFLALRRAVALPAAPLGGRAAHRARARPRPRRRRAHGGRAGGRRGRRRPAGRPGRRRRAAHHPPAAGPRQGPVPCRLTSRDGHARRRSSRASTPRSSPTDPERGTDAAHVLDEVRRAHPLLPNADAMAVATRRDRARRRARAARAAPRRRRRHRGDGERAGLRVGRAPRRAPARGDRPRAAATSTSSSSGSSGRSACGPTARRRSPTPACPTGRG